MSPGLSRWRWKNRKLVLKQCSNFVKRDRDLEIMLKRCEKFWNIPSDIFISVPIFFLTKEIGHRIKTSNILQTNQNFRIIDFKHWHDFKLLYVRKGELALSPLIVWHALRQIFKAQRTPWAWYSSSMILKVNRLSAAFSPHCDSLITIQFKPILIQNDP